MGCDTDSKKDDVKESIEKPIDGGILYIKNDINGNKCTCSSNTEANSDSNGSTSKGDDKDDNPSSPQKGKEDDVEDKTIDSKMGCDTDSKKDDVKESIEKFDYRVKVKVLGHSFKECRQLRSSLRNKSVFPYISYLITKEIKEKLALEWKDHTPTPKMCQQSMFATEYRNDICNERYMLCNFFSIIKNIEYACSKKFNAKHLPSQKKSKK